MSETREREGATPESAYLRALARRIANAYRECARPAAALLTGSVAEGESDRYSDLDLILYYEALPSEVALRDARDRCEASDFQLLGQGSEREFAEIYKVDGVECQVAHTTIVAWEDDMASVLERLEVESPTQKALGGLLDGMPLYGDDLIGRWHARAAMYPDALAQGMVTHYLHFFPIWYIADRLATRDATLWFYQAYVESAQNILGVLAGLNRLYYSTFQFKRMRAFTGKMRLAPDHLADWLERLFTANRSDAIAGLEALASATVALVHAHMPEVDTANQPPFSGQRARPWTPQPKPWRDE
jgi:nucleotidyltransferase-like protein